MPQHLHIFRSVLVPQIFAISKKQQHSSRFELLVEENVYPNILEVSVCNRMIDYRIESWGQRSVLVVLERLSPGSEVPLLIF